MILIVLALALALVLVVLVYFLRQQRDETWERFRRHQRDRARRAGPEHPIDPAFRFDEPASPTDLQQE